MTAIILSILATIITAISIGVAGNIYDVPPPVCYACRWAVSLYGFTGAALLFALAYRYTFS